LTEDREIADFFEETARLHGNGKTVSNWVMRDILGFLNERGIGIRETKLTPASLAGLIGLVEEGRTTAGSARSLLPELAETAVTDTAEIEAVAREAIEANPKQATQYRAGQEKLLNFFVGQVMKRTGGKASPGLVSEVLTRLLAGS
jgi:aspartyl-tRNA(Asn)/glutamyl-tRNA(Gln) amidotransferase subunit B